MKYLLVLSLLLAACGPSAKKDAVFGDNGGGVRDGICPANYAPLPLFRDGFAPLPGPEALPLGVYHLTATEAYIRTEALGLQAHFSDTTRAGEVVFRKVCTSEAPEREILSVEFPGLREFTRGATDSFRPGSAFIQLERGVFNFTKPVAGAVETGSIASVLEKWGHTNIFKLSDTEYELRFYSYTVVGPFQATKRLAMRYSFIPAP